MCIIRENLNYNYEFMKKRIFMLGMLGILWGATSCASLSAGVGHVCNVRVVDEAAYREGKVVTTLIADGAYKVSRDVTTISVAYLLMENGDVVVICEDPEKIVLPYTKDEAKVIMMSNLGQNIEIIYHSDE